MVGVSIEDELKRHPELKTRDLDSLKEWLAKQPHLPSVPEELLVLFMNSCDYSLERTKKTIDSHYTIRTLAPEILGDRDPNSKEIENIFKVINLAIIPKPDKDGNRYMFFKLRDTNPNKFAFCPLIKVQNMATELSQRLYGAESGYIFVYDVHGNSAGHMAKVQFSVLRKFIVYLQEAMPLKMKSLHLINCNPLMEKLVEWVKPLMKNEIMNLVHMHSGSIDDLHHSIPREVTPKDYGGEQDCLDNLTEDLQKQMHLHRDWFLKDQNLKADETKRPGKAKTEGEMFGLEGSFRKLEID